MGKEYSLTDLWFCCWWYGWDGLWLFEDCVGICAGLLPVLTHGGLETAKWPSQWYCAHAGLYVSVGRWVRERERERERERGLATFGGGTVEDKVSMRSMLENLWGSHLLRSCPVHSFHQQSLGDWPALPLKLGPARPPQDLGRHFAQPQLFENLENRDAGELDLATGATSIVAMSNTKIRPALRAGRAAFEASTRTTPVHARCFSSTPANQRTASTSHTTHVARP